MSIFLNLLDSCAFTITAAVSNLRSSWSYSSPMIRNIVIPRRTTFSCLFLPWINRQQALLATFVVFDKSGAAESMPKSCT